ncbi:hypothetical protein VTN00DRAFT_7766 [Thermoascus crustaceus]|uniref:uncharacterized protein n=1 Tax=Thermoascus crustaceus TaxID=5088 RepID=UPI003742B89A
MPRRQTNLRGPKDESKKSKSKRKGGRGLEALAIAEKEYPSKPRIRRSRLGESDEIPKRKHDSDEEDEPDTKRRRTGDESDSSDNHGSDSEGHEWRIGQVDSDDDEELDSDEAMGSSDEERFAGFTFRGSSSNKSKSKRSASNTKRKGEIDLNEDVDVMEDESEDEDEDEDDLGSDAVDLATAWDMNAEEDESEEASSKPKKDTAENSEDESESEEYDDDLSDDSGLSVSDEEEDAENQRGLSKLQSFVNSMEGDVSSKPSRKTNAGQEHGKPSEYGLMSTRKLTVADLIPSVTDSRLKSSLKHLDPTTSQKSKSTGKLEAPLPKRQQDRLDRAAAYEKSKETLDRWIETVKANRRAEHLSFPLVDPSTQQLPRMDVAKPQTDLEQTIQNILVESGLAGSNEKSAEEQVKEFEELEAKKLSLEELRARRAELRKHRELMFREEVRAKRIKKIKSKSYRRVHRKEREKMEQMERQALIEAGVDLDEEERERLDRKRAEARMGAKHRESKWAKSLKQTGRAAWDEDARMSVADMARRDDELQKRIEGKRVTRADDDEFLGSSSSESDDEDEDPWNEEAGSDVEARKLRQKLSELEADGSTAEDIKGPHSKLMSMKFMQNAEASRKAQNDAEIRRLKRELQGEDSQSEAESEVGRQSFGRSKAQGSEQPKPSQPKNEFEEAPGSDDEDTRVPEPDDDVQIVVDRPKDQVPAKFSGNAPQPRGQKKSVEKEPAEEENPWLTQTGRNNRQRATDAAHESVDITLSGPTPTNDEPTSQGVKAQGKDGSKDQSKTQKPRKDDDAQSETDEEDRVPVLLKNHDLVKKAFAGDEVTYDFDKEKLETIEEEGDKVIDSTLPGWGSWTGEGISKKQQKRQKRFLTKVEGVKPENRKDAKLGRVIINEKRVKKNTKYLATQLPHPFESKQQYERSLRLPIGPEWTTKETFQNATKPRVMVKQGVIKPMEKPLI